MTDQPSGSLRELAAAYGIATEFWTFGGEHRTVPTSTILAILAAMGVAAADDATNQELLRVKDEEPWRRTLPYSVVARSGHAHRIPVHVIDGTSVSVFVELEDGGRVDAVQVEEWVAPREIDGVLIGRATFKLPKKLPLGWHTIVAETESGVERAPLAVTPDRLDACGADGD
ncbi:MAG: 4-alpha-glucanotransferase, partial [Ruaniaceae bacterium]|nr:4-alpha-glucanotransferase [Ruaniaceae bacterium]